jgi:hypothetical protein
VSDTLVDGRKQVIQDGLSNINSVDSDNATDSFTLPASSSGGKGSSDILSKNKTPLALSAATSSVLTLTQEAVATPSIVLAAVTSSTLPAAAISFRCQFSTPATKALQTLKLNTL